MEKIVLAEDCEKWRAVVNMVMNLDMIYLLTAVGLSPGSTHLHTNNT